jgi:tetraacyldisaccharide-1-P 4'-kinase
MGIKQIPISKFIKRLESKGLQYIRTTASRDHYNYPERDPRRLTRNITVRTKDKDIPQFHIHSILQAA